MSISKVGKSKFRIDLNEQNLRYVSTTVLNQLLEHLEERIDAGELLHFQKIEEHLRAILKSDLKHIQVKMNHACERTLNQSPIKTNRKNLFGRALVEKIILNPATTEDWLIWFKSHYLHKFLIQIRISMGVQNYDYFNELLDMALQNECVIRDLEQAHIDWHAFFSHRRLPLMLKKACQLRHWVCVLDNQELFLNAVNTETAEGIRPFQSKDLWHILDAWEYSNEEVTD